MSRKNLVKVSLFMAVIVPILLVAGALFSGDSKEDFIPLTAIETKAIEETIASTEETTEPTEETSAPVAPVAEFEEVLEEVEETTKATEPVETPQETEAEIVEATEATEEPTEATESVEETESDSEYVTYYTYDDAVMLAITMYGEARGLGETEQACVAWTILNRVDDGRFGSSIAGVITAPGQFHGYYPGGNTIDDSGRDLVDLALDVLERWNREKNGESDVGRVLPSDYLYFAGSNGHNWFRTGYNTNDYWDYSWGSPYAS